MNFMKEQRRRIATVQRELAARDREIVDMARRVARLEAEVELAERRTARQRQEGS